MQVHRTPKTFCRRVKQKGTALIFALFIISVVAAIAITLMSRLSRDIRRTALLQHHIQAELYAQGALAWAMDSLISNWKQRQTNKPIDLLPLSLSPQKVQQYVISSTIDDAQSRFNLNNLGNQEWQISFKRLLQLIEPRLNEENAQKITQSLANWIAPLEKNIDDENYYAHLSQPYTASHHPMVNVAELRLVKGITEALYMKILPFVTALPVLTALNVNTAPPPLLQSLSQTLPADSAKALAAQRKQTAFSSAAQFLNNAQVKPYAIAPSKITINSEYFIVKTIVATEDQQWVFHTLMHRKIKNLNPGIEILWQSKDSA